MSNINNFLSINRSVRSFYTNLSYNFYTPTNSFPPKLINNTKIYRNNLFSSYNTHLNYGYVRCFGTSVSKTSSQSPVFNQNQSKLYAPYVYEEVMAPTGGGPIYWKTRKFIMNFKRRLNLRARERRWNWDVVRAAFAGVPKLSYDPKINQWITLMDNEEWGGVGGRFWIEFSNKVLLNFLYAFLLYFFWYRIIANNKHNVFARWKNRDNEEDE